MIGLSSSRKFEIGAALVLTLAALALVGLKVWAADKPPIQVSDAWARPTIGQSRMSAAYLRIANESDTDDALTGVQSPEAEAVELHQTKMTPVGVMQMRKVEGGLAIPAGGTLVLEPGGTHLMLLGVKDALSEGDALVLTLDFERAGTVEIRVPVKTAAP